MTNFSLTYLIVSASTAMVLVTGCGKSDMHSQVTSQSGDPSAATQTEATSTTTSSSTSTTITNFVTTTTVEAYPDQVSRANHHKLPPAYPGAAEFDPSLLAPGTLKKDFSIEGDITPTVYYNAIINDDNVCTEDQRVGLFGLKGVEITKVCQKTLDACGLQGSCTVVTKGIAQSYNVISQVKGVDHFMKLDPQECPFGLGVRSICLDPFYTVAADLKIYQPGDVIFIPALVGVPLLRGKVHNGFFIVRDQGRGIVGKGRFDFFSGFYSWRDPRNPFAAVKLPDSHTKLLFYRVTGESAKIVLNSRSYPDLPTLINPAK